MEANCVYFLRAIRAPLDGWKYPLHEARPAGAASIDQDRPGQRPLGPVAATKSDPPAVSPSREQWTHFGRPRSLSAAAAPASALRMRACEPSSLMSPISSVDDWLADEQARYTARQGPMVTVCAWGPPLRVMAVSCDAAIVMLRLRDRGQLLCELCRAALKSAEYLLTRGLACAPAATKFH
ncbi:uncharacterized protein SCHCODRAFT_02130441 [Schizophyllum commune H4-8]|uniref:uncharacterized protein n=1 Tax=Schizophyllum commune (strain H4-8 / FGSC 9210) TaxID=578458 RepID=UPI002160D8D3|nr:uncharacterized protein SCHCODRAFT_02130441 [Schizophyllum commune H4-8]KAI5885058.1 hypothetical protein SCHCODRAFT_02130441 [Schizophyllum commune H4-8]